MAAHIDPHRASPRRSGVGAGDTVWFGAIDAAGRAVSAIQSLYFEFGSGGRTAGFGLRVAEPRLRVPARRRRTQPAGAAAQTLPHPEPSLGAFLGRPHHGLRSHGWGWPAADAGSAIHALCVLRTGSSAGDLGAPLAARPHLGRGAYRTSPGEPVPRRTLRGTRCGGGIGRSASPHSIRSWGMPAPSFIRRSRDLRERVIRAAMAQRSVVDNAWYTRHLYPWQSESVARRFRPRSCALRANLGRRKENLPAPSAMTAMQR